MSDKQLDEMEQDAPMAAEDDQTEEQVTEEETESEETAAEEAESEEAADEETAADETADEEEASDDASAEEAVDESESAEGSNDETEEPASEESESEPVAEAAPETEEAAPEPTAAPETPEPVKVTAPTEYVPSVQRGRSRRIRVRIRMDEISYKNIPLLTRFLDPYGRILSRRKTGVSAKMQRKAVREIKRARHLSLLPYTGDHTRVARLKRRR